MYYLAHKSQLQAQLWFPKCFRGDDQEITWETSRSRFRLIVCWLFIIWFVFACVLSISSSYPGSSLCCSLSPCYLSRQSLLASLTRSVIERKQTKKNLWWQENRRTSSNKKLFCGHFTHFLLIHTSVLVLGEVFWECSRVIRCLSDETFTETLETRKQTDGQKKLNAETKTQRKQKALDVLSWKHRTII